jgi:cytochrome d ubiquinol oxidase subunit I
MGLTLACHIISAAVGVSLPYVMTVGGWRWRSTKDPVYLLLAKR